MVNPLASCFGQKQNNRTASQNYTPNRQLPHVPQIYFVYFLSFSIYNHDYAFAFTVAYAFMYINNLRMFEIYVYA